MYKIILLVAAVLTTILTTSALAADYNYVSPDQFKQWLDRIEALLRTAYHDGQ